MIEVGKDDLGHVAIITDAKLKRGHQVLINGMAYVERDVLVAARLVLSEMENRYLLAFKGILQQRRHDEYSHEAILLKAIDEEFDSRL